MTVFKVLTKSKEDGQILMTYQEEEFLKLVGRKIVSEREFVMDPEDDILYIGLFPTTFTDSRDFVNYLESRNRMNTTILIDYRNKNGDPKTKIIRNGLRGMKNFLKSQLHEIKIKGLYDMNMSFVSYDDIMEEDVEKNIYEVIRKERFINIELFKYDYEEGKIIIV